MSITYLEAIRAAQARALEEDPRVFIYGQDVGSFGGAFKATKNLAREHPGRVLDAPISEDAMVGCAVGAAIEGMRPIAINGIEEVGIGCTVCDALSPEPLVIRRIGRHARGRAQRAAERLAHPNRLRTLARKNQTDSGYHRLLDIVEIPWNVNGKKFCPFRC